MVRLNPIDRHLKVAIEQALILRGSRDFETVGDYSSFVDELVARRNKHHSDALEIELQHFQPLPARRTTDFTEIVVQVVRTGGFLVNQIFYSAPSCLIGQRLRVHIHNHHHVIHALKRKPGALANSIYRNSLFPRTEYVLVWKALQAALSCRDACRRMVDSLFLAYEENAEAELASLMADDLQQGRLSDAQGLKTLLVPRDHRFPKDVVVNLPALSCFDMLLGNAG